MLGFCKFERGKSMHNFFGDILAFSMCEEIFAGTRKARNCEGTKATADAWARNSQNEKSAQTILAKPGKDLSGCTLLCMATGAPPHAACVCDRVGRIRELIISLCDTRLTAESWCNFQK